MVLQPRTLIRQRQLRFALKLNERVRARESSSGGYYETDLAPRLPPTSWYGSWNMQYNDAAAFGHLQGFPLGNTPLPMTTWSDGRTMWDEVRVLQFIFSGDAEPCRT
jgi:hypothetical protein